MINNLRTNINEQVAARLFITKIVLNICLRRLCKQAMAMAMTMTTVMLQIGALLRSPRHNHCVRLLHSGCATYSPLFMIVFFLCSFCSLFSFLLRCIHLFFFSRLLLVVLLFLIMQQNVFQFDE